MATGRFKARLGRTFCMGAVVAGALAGAMPASAQVGASLDLSATPQTNDGSDITLNVTGHAIRNGSWAIFLHDVDVPCGATADEEKTGDGGGSLGEEIANRLNVEEGEDFDDDTIFSPEAGVSYRFCALLGDYNQNNANPPDARDEVVVCRRSTHLAGDTCVADPANVIGTAAPPGLTFPGEAAGTTSPSQTVTITSAIDGLIPDIVLQSTDAANFHIVNDGCTNQRLTIGQTCTFGVTFTPNAVRVFLANVDLNCFDARDEPVQGSDCEPGEVDLRGVGVAGGGGGGGGCSGACSSGSNPSSSSGSNGSNDPGPAVAVTPPPPPDLAPVSSGFRLDPDRIASSQATTAQSRNAFVFDASEAGTATIAIFHRARGIQLAGRCLRATQARRARHRGAPGCVLLSPRGSIVGPASGGANRMAYSGRNPLNGRQLRPGLYEARLVLVDSAGQSSAPASALFRMLRPRR